MTAASDSKINRHKQSGQVIPRNILWPFILVTSLFALWGFANDITNPMVAAFKNILLISNFQSSLVQFAFYGGYCVMAIPAALFIKRYSYKAGILVGLSLYATGCMLFIPSGWMMAFWFFLLAYFIITCGLSFLETSANPYILAMGPEETSTRRLNFAQSFNPMGSLLGMFVAMNLILANLNPMTETGRRAMEDMAGGKTYHQQIIDAAVDALTGVQREVDNTDPALLQTGIKMAYNQLMLISPEWSVKSTEAVQLLVKAAEANGVQRKKAMTAAHEQIQETFKGQDAFTNLRTGEIDIGALDQAALAQEEYEQGSQELKSILEGARSEAQTILNKLSPMVASETLIDIPLKEVIAEVLPVLTQTSKTLKTIQSLVSTSLAKTVSNRLTKIRKADLNVIIGPYIALGIVVFLVLVVFTCSKLPRSAGEDDKRLALKATLKRLISNKKYLQGVVAQTFYVGVQIMCWTFIIQYAEAELGMPKPEAQKYNIFAMTFFVSSRFICTHLLKYISPGRLLSSLAVCGGLLVIGTIFFHGMTGLYCLIAVSACMSLMFPTIYGIALKGLGDDAKLGSAGLILAIGGGSVMPPLQAYIMDKNAFNLGFITLSSTRASFVLPLICFIVIAYYGLNVSRKNKSASVNI